MPRMKMPRRVQGPPTVGAFFPEEHPPWGMDEIILPVEGLEAIRLCDFEGFDQQAAAERMEISRPTMGRVLADARGIVAEALVMGKRLVIKGGNYEIATRRRGPRHFRGSRDRNL
ncbi:conserved hypothetical protein [Candidatus Desulfarcum epimagneticum]|uniref:UPF0251 protein EPICR_40217 n=1 Tax=uncultured Desulfobacteraceae bacterium TaxID=218296 RepID=A0A484HHK5_9BACT|nr:conserved hypothetical protein [uncultured Desulfobacteraceae bacterium]